MDITTHAHLIHLTLHGSRAVLSSRVAFRPPTNQDPAADGWRGSIPIRSHLVLHLVAPVMESTSQGESALIDHLNCSPSSTRDSSHAPATVADVKQRVWFSWELGSGRIFILFPEAMCRNFYCRAQESNLQKPMTLM